MCPMKKKYNLLMRDNNIILNIYINKHIYEALLYYNIFYLN